MDRRDWASHADAYLQLLPASSEVLMGEAHLKVFEVPWHQSTNADRNIEEVQGVLDELVGGQTRMRWQGPATPLQVTFFFLALWICCHVTAERSRHPGNPDTSAFWQLGSMYPLVVRQLVSLSARMEKIFPSTFRSAMLLNWLMMVESASLPLPGYDLVLPGHSQKVPQIFQIAWEVLGQFLFKKKSKSNDGVFFGFSCFVLCLCVYLFGPKKLSVARLSSCHGLLLF